MSFKRIKILVSLILVLLPFVGQVRAQVAASSALDSTKMMIGDQTNLHLSIQYSANVTIRNVDYSNLEKDEHIELIRNGTFDTIRQGDLTILQKDLLFTVYDSGSFWVPKIKVNYDRNGSNTTIMTNEIPIEITTPQQDSVYLAPIKPIIRESLTWRDVLPYALGILGFALVVGLILFFYYRSGEKEIPPPPVRKVPAHEISNQKLKVLAQKQLWQNGDVKGYQSELTYIVREYLENRYEVQALESTTAEILNQLKALDFDDTMKAQLHEMLQLADMVKFAKAEPPVEAHERLMNYASSFVDKTKPELTAEGYKEGLVILPPEEISALGVTPVVEKKETNDLTNAKPAERYILAGFWRRYFASIIDINLFHILYVVLIFLLGMLFGVDDPSEALAGFIFVFVILSYFVFGLVYYVYPLVKGRQTIGYKITGIEVVDFDVENLTWGRSFVRFIVKIFSVSPFICIPYLSFFFTKKKQTLHDIAAKSIVIKKVTRSETNDILDV